MYLHVFYLLHVHVLHTYTWITKQYKILLNMFQNVYDRSGDNEVQRPGESHCQAFSEHWEPSAAFLS